MKKPSIILFFAFLFMFPQNGNCQLNTNWQKCLGGSKEEPNYGNIPSKSIKTFDNSFVIISGTNSDDGDVSNSNGDSYGDIWVVKLDSLGNKLWDKCLGGNNNDFPYSIKETNDSCYIVMGTTASTNISNYHKNYDLLISKLNKNGTILWQKSFGGSGFDSDAKNNNGYYGNQGYSPQHIIEKSNGNFIIVSETRSNDGDIKGFHTSANYAQDIWVIEIDHDGNLIRQKCIGGTNYDIPIEIIQDKNQLDYLILGVTNSNDGDVNENYGSNDFAIFKLDTLFNIIWTKVIGTSKDDYPASMIVENDGKIIVSGIVDGPNLGYDGQIVIFKLDIDGNIIYFKNYGGSNDEGGIGNGIVPPILHPINDKGYIFGTITNSVDGNFNLNNGGYDYWIVKLDSSGNIIWDKLLGTNRDEFGIVNIHTKTNGEIFISLIVNDSSGNLSNIHYKGWNDIGILKFDLKGNLTSYNCFGGSSIDRPADICFDSVNNNYILLCFTYSDDGDVKNNHGNGDLWVLNISSNFSNSIEKINNGNKIAIFPNPISESFTIDLENYKSKYPVNLTILNYLGQVIQSEKIYSSKNTIKLNDNVMNEAYFFQISNQEGAIIGISKLIRK